MRKHISARGFEFTQTIGGWVCVIMGKTFICRRHNSKLWRGQFQGERNCYFGETLDIAAYAAEHAQLS